MTEQVDPRVEALLEAARKKFAPDRRTVVFDITASLLGDRLTVKGEVHNDNLKRQLLNFIKDDGNFLIVDSLSVLPAATVGDKTYGVVSVSVANIRAKPGHAAELATQAILGTPLRILKKERGWYYVQTPDAYLGWMDDGMTTFTQSEYDEWSSEPKIIITSTYAHSYASSDKDHEIVSDLVVGNILKLTGTAGSFFTVEYPGGDIAYVKKSDASLLANWLAEVRDTPDKIITTAKRFMGVPYLWGGTSAKAMDCSGFTKTVFFMNGVLLPRDASQQVFVGEPVTLTNDFASLKKGDLLFFGRSGTNDRKEKVTHVGIYLESSRFIHESGHVRINSLNPADPDFSEVRRKTLLRAMRVIGVGEDRGVQRLVSIPYFRGNEQQ